VLGLFANLLFALPRFSGCRSGIRQTPEQNKNTASSPTAAASAQASVSSTASGMPSEVPRELAQGMKRASLHLTPQARRRALVLLASCPDGCTEAIFAAHNIPAEIVAKLLRKGLATAGAERVGRLWITERGRRELIGW
jgi:hypothetical protein